MDADEGTFSALFERHRRELRAHCYRMVGSFEDSEDLVQDTFARAWRARARFRREGRWSFRAWLYRIATNACLDHVARHGPRVLPVDLAPAADPEADVPPVAADVRWLEPYPDRLVDPHEAVVARETLEIGFVAAIQHLPPRQRAALILRDVAGFSARQTATLLDTSVPAVNSALQRARSRLRERLPSRREDWRRSDAPAEQLEVARLYVEAIERRDFAALAALVREDARFSFPPHPLWYDGLDAFRRGSEKHAARGKHLLVAARANLQPAVAIYLQSPGEARFRPLALSVLRVEAGRVVEAVDWGRPELFGAFGLPMSFPSSHRSNKDRFTAKEVR
ncbi:MAG TPA: RNA polymerase subunit sigma-70 [Solirubrobacteraceae bacterium]|nr:RNA polymerase subunit sigma-70 [Solirubrobacteraceae bacterium]